MNVVTILLRLLPADGGISCGLLSFDHSQGLVVFTQQNVVAELMALIRQAGFRYAYRESNQDVELLNHLQRVFYVPTGLRQLLVNKR